MIEENENSVEVNLMTEHGVILLKDVDSEQLLPIFIGPYEAEAIAIRMRGIQVSRPLTHDLLNNVITEMEGEVSHITVNALRNDTFYAYITVNAGQRTLEIDSRPSDAIALAVRVDAPIFVDEEVMAQAGIIPEEDVAEEIDEDLSAFSDFVDTLDLDDLPAQ